MLADSIGGSIVTCICFPFLLFFLQIYANCRIRRVFFTDRLYSDQELPGDFKVNIIERKTAPSTNTRMAEKWSLVPTESVLESHGKGASKQRPGTGLQTTTEENSRGFHTILNSVVKAPLKLWKEEVSICVSSVIL